MVARYPVTVRAVTEKDGRFLVLVKKVNNKLELSFPGGLVEYGESLEEALKREVKEETGLEVEPVKIIHANKFVHPRFGEEEVGISYLCKVVGGSIKPGSEPDQEFIAIRWLSFDELEPWMKEIVRKLVSS